MADRTRPQDALSAPIHELIESMIGDVEDRIDARFQRLESMLRMTGALLTTTAEQIADLATGSDS